MSEQEKRPSRSNVVTFTPRSRQPDDVPQMTGPNQTCECGDQWWTGGSVVFTEDGSVTGYTIDWRCASCGKAQPTQASPSPGHRIPVESGSNQRGPGWDEYGAPDEADMCPNCVTPWKCNGPHLPTENGPS